MAQMGPTTAAATQLFAGSLVKLARLKRGLTQRELARRAGVPPATVAEIESGRRQPSWPVLCRILAGADLMPTVRLVDYDTHDDVLDATRAKMTVAQRTAEDAALDEWAAALRPADAAQVQG
jgi:transcriptional regulator with XRE-family HTH domain